MGSHLVARVGYYSLRVRFVSTADISGKFQVRQSGSDGEIITFPGRQSAPVLDPPLCRQTNRLAD